jgi:5-methylcytosine-specific restriction protein A
MYKTKRWKAKRKRILRKAEYLCQESKRYGKHVTATTVHHIFPVDEYPSLAFVDENLLALSESKHNQMHDRSTGKITELGKYWQAKASPLLEGVFLCPKGTGRGTLSNRPEIQEEG